MNLSNVKIRAKLGLLAGLLLLIAIAVGLVGWHGLSGNNVLFGDVVRDGRLLEQSVDLARSAQVEFKVQIQEWKNLLLRSNDPANLTKYREEFIKRGEAAQEDLKKLKEVLAQLRTTTPQLDETMTELAGLTTKYLEASKQYASDNPNSSHTVDALVKGMDREPSKKIDGLVVFVLERAKTMMTELEVQAAATYREAIIVMVAFIGLALVVGSALTVWIVRNITGSLDQAVEAAKEVANGNLATEIVVTGTDEVGQLLESLKQMHESLHKICSNIRVGTASMAISAQEIADGNLDLSSRTEQQASSLEETAASMEELTSTVKKNADNAHEANTLASMASQVAMKGGAVVSKVVETMGSINDSSRKIVDIIAVIDGIAFQTNILALNAAVEAARAGEQGRGFAVVASEVRNLAQRSAAAAKEIKALIENSVDQVDTGAKLVDQAGATMEEIVVSVRRVTNIIGEIASATTEQTTGIEEINRAITQMDEVTQKNAALVEEAAAAADSMKIQAGQLETVVSIFRLGDVTPESSPQKVQTLRGSTYLPPKQRPAQLAGKRLPSTTAKSPTGDSDDWEQF